MRGRKPKPHSSAVKVAGAALPRCPPHLDDVARAEWRRLAKPMYDAGVLTIADRAALAAYCQAYARWVEAEERLKETPMLLKTPSGYVQQSPWLTIANKQMELMNRYMTELGLTPVARTRLKDSLPASGHQPIEIVMRFGDEKEVVEHESWSKAVRVELDEDTTKL
jgi:P27 family predicted phage terminase small subunit